MSIEKKIVKKKKRRTNYRTMVTRSIRLRKADWDIIEEIAAARGMSKTDWVREVFSEKLTKSKTEKLPLTQREKSVLAGSLVGLWRLVGDTYRRRGTEHLVEQAAEEAEAIFGIAAARQAAHKRAYADGFRKKSERGRGR